MGELNSFEHAYLKPGSLPENDFSIRFGEVSDRSFKFMDLEGKELLFLICLLSLWSGKFRTNFFNDVL